MMRTLSLRIKLVDGSTGPTAALRRLLELPLLWQERAESRRRLAEMDEHMLRDIGLYRGDVAREAAKPFWLA